MYIWYTLKRRLLNEHEKIGVPTVPTIIEDLVATWTDCTYGTSDHLVAWWYSRSPAI